LADSGLKILMLAPTPYFADRGCHVRIYEEARALCSLGHDVRIVTYHLGRDMPGIPVFRILNIPWYHKLEAGPSWHKLYLDLLLLARALPILFSFRPHIIHAHLHEGAFIGLLLKKICGVPLLMDFQGSLTGECIDHGFIKFDSPVARIFRWIEQMINKSADMIITSSSAAAADLINQWNMPKEKVIPLIDGVDTEVFRPYPQYEGRERLALPKEIPVVAYLGVLNSYQGIDLLLDCIAQLKSETVKVHFLIMGFPHEGYRDVAAGRGISDMITFTGRINYQDAPLLLSAADIAVTPKLSPTEANGKVFNYMACALPVIAFDTPVNREAMGDSGIYVKYGDASDLAEKIKFLLTDLEARKSYSALVSEKAFREHSWLARGTLLADLYLDLLKNNN